MIAPKLFRALGRVHLWMGVAVGFQVVIWFVSGLFMVWFPIDEVRGSHLRANQPPASLNWPADALSAATLAAQLEDPVVSLEARMLLDEPVWLVRTHTGRGLYDARTGEALGLIDQAQAREIARTRYAGRGEMSDIRLLASPPREAGLSTPAWAAVFSGPDRATLYVNAQTGDLRAVRTPLWRTFDWFWGLHIMDWSTRENFNSWWVKMTTLLAVLFALTGVGLTVIRLWPR